MLVQPEGAAFLFCALSLLDCITLRSKFFRPRIIKHFKTSFEYQFRGTTNSLFPIVREKIDESVLFKLCFLHKSILCWKMKNVYFLFYVALLLLLFI